MQMQYRAGARFRPGLSFVLLALLLGVLWLAGGASRADALGQAVVRCAASIALALLLLLGEQPRFGGARPVLWLLLAALAIAVVQLIPLPPGLWRMFPGRALIEEAAAASGQSQPWRPWSMVPGATLNAAASLIVPFAVLVLGAGLSDRERQWLPGMVLGLIAAGMFLGLLQFAGIRFSHPLINDTLGEVGGNFANRNHFALFLAMGCLLAPVWALLDGRQPQWRGPVALGLLVLFALTILASGSRAGMALGVLGVGIGLTLARQGIRRALARYPRWVFPALIAGVVGAIAFAILLSIAADRAVSIDRALAVDPGQDMRGRGLPTVLAMIRTYFPMGSGLGGFDPVFRIHEPFGLLKLTFFNHAHNDFLEVLLDTGLAGALLLGAALLWCGWASLRAWRAGSQMRYAMPKLGSAMLLFVIVASAVDYPARTPMMMAMVVIAALWLGGASSDRASALPKQD